MITEIRRFLGYETDDEKLVHHSELRKSFTDMEANLDRLANDFYIEKSLFQQRMENPDNFTIQGIIKSKFDKYLERHKDEIRKAKKQYDGISKEILKIEKLLGEEKVNQSKRLEAYPKIKKAYQDGLVSLESFNKALSGITKDKITKYSDVILFNQEGKILILKRSSWEDRNGGAWCIPGGHVDPGEDFYDAAIRELREETGFNIETCLNVGSYKDDKAHIEYFRGEVNTNEQSHVLQWEEVRDYKWVCLHELKDYPMIFNMYDNLVSILHIKDEPKQVIRKAILAGFISVDQIIEKAKSGKYKFNKQNIKEGIAGTEYGKKKEPEDKFKKEKDYAKRVIKGIESLKRLSPAEEQGRMLGGKRNVEATILLGANAGANPTYQGGHTKAEQEDTLRQYAQQEGIWVDDYLNTDWGKQEVGSGGEAIVYRVDDNTVYKVNHYPFEEEPLKFLDRIAIHNTISPEAPYELLGFTEKEVDGEKVFAAIIKQPFIESTGDLVLPEEVEQEMQKRGFTESSDGTYLNDDYSIGDLHPGNVLRSPEGNLIFIDPMIELNTPEAGYGGNRELGEIIIGEDSVQKGFITSYIGEEIEKGGKDLSKLTKKRVLVTRGGKTFLTTVYVDPKTGMSYEKDSKEVDHTPIISDVAVGDTVYLKTPKTEGEFTITSICLDKGTDPYLVFLDADGKVRTVMTKALTKLEKRSSEALLEDDGIDVDFSDLSFVKRLGGSSGVELYQDSKGDQYAVKPSHKGDDRQLIQEVAVNKIYRAFGLGAPISEFKNGKLISKYIEGASQLSLITKTVTNKAELNKGFVLDCLLANWDVLGQAEDNVLFKAGKAYRIDNGGCLRIRARGGEKTLDVAVGEIDSMRDTEPGKTWFNTITDSDIENQIKEIRAKFSNFNYLNDVIGGYYDIEMLDKRLKWLEDRYGIGAVSVKKTTASKKVLRPDMPSLVTQDYFDSDEWKAVDIAGNPKMKEHIKNHIIRIEKSRESEYKSVAASEGITVEELKQKMLMMVKDIVGRSKGYIVAHSSGGHKGDDVVGKIISGGRFKSQFEVKESCGALDPYYRSRTENGYYGISDDVKHEPENRPIYGFFTDQEHGAINSAGTVPPKRTVNQYGDVCFQVSEDKFRKDSTITFRDSLGDYSIISSSPTSCPHFTSTVISHDRYRELKEIYSSKVDGGIGSYYVEAQYHGQLKLDDIEKVHIAVESYTKSELTNVINEVTSATLKGGKYIPIEMF